MIGTVTIRQRKSGRTRRSDPRLVGDIIREMFQMPEYDEESGETNIVSMSTNRKSLKFSI